MTSGLPWRELNSPLQDYFPWVSSPDPLLWILQKPFAAEPRTKWNYDTGASHIPSAVLTAATGLSERELASRNLFTPLGEDIGPWPADPQGRYYGGHGISLTGRTLIKIGRLMLDKGVHRGKQIVSERWVKESTTEYHTTNNALPRCSGYGYLWWSGRDAGSGLTFTAAVGYGGQFIIIVPEKDAVIAAATSLSSPNARASENFAISTIMQNVLPHLQ
jgi:CubicO group peptidase (beta-lactamase class C family)